MSPRSEQMPLHLNLVASDNAWCNRLLSSLRRNGLALRSRIVDARTDITDSACELWLLVDNVGNTGSTGNIGDAGDAVSTASDCFLAAYQQADIDTPVIMLGRQQRHKTLPGGVEWLQADDEALTLQCLTWRLQWQACQQHNLQLTRNLALLDRHYHALLADSPTATVLINEDRVLACNTAFTELVDAGSSNALTGQAFCGLFSTGDKQKLTRLYTSASLPGSRHTLVTRDNQRLDCHFSAGVYRGEACLCLTAEREERPASKVGLQHADILAQLENQPAFHQRLETALAVARSQGKRSMLLVARIEHFQRVLETLGKARTMQVVTDVAGFLGNAISKPYTASKLGADEFGILVFDASPDEAARVADYIRSRVNNGLLPAGIDAFTLSAAIGLAIINRQGQSAAALIHRARLNTGNVLQHGTNKPARQQLIRQLHAALKGQKGKEGREHNTIQLAFQPLIALRPPAQSAYRVTWQLPGQTSSALTTSALIAEANMQGIGMAVDQCVLQQLLADDMHSNQQVPYLVSLSSNTLAELAFPAWFSRACRSHQRSPEQFQFLISEIDMHSHDRQVRAFCQRLEALGISWQLTDFGSAMDPLAVLAQVKPAAVMLDPALLRDLQYSKSQQDTLEKLTAAIHACGMSVLATQLENADQLPRLFRLGIDGVQGNCLQTPRPLPDYGFPQNRTLGSTA